MIGLDTLEGDALSLLPPLDTASAGLDADTHRSRLFNQLPSTLRLGEEEELFRSRSSLCSDLAPAGAFGAHPATAAATATAPSVPSLPALLPPSLPLLPRPAAQPAHLPPDCCQLLLCPQGSGDLEEVAEFSNNNSADENCCRMTPPRRGRAHVREEEDGSPALLLRTAAAASLSPPAKLTRDRPLARPGAIDFAGCGGEAGEAAAPASLASELPSAAMLPPRRTAAAAAAAGGGGGTSSQQQQHRPARGDRRQPAAAPAPAAHAAAAAPSAAAVAGRPLPGSGTSADTAAATGAASAAIAASAGASAGATAGAGVVGGPTIGRGPPPRGAVPPVGGAVPATPAMPAVAGTPSGPASALSLEYLEANGYFDMPLQHAAAELGVGVTTLKKVCRQHHIERWPYRKRSSLDRLITRTREHLAGNPQQCRVALAELEAEKANLRGNLNGDLPEHLKKYRQSIFKKEFKARRGAAGANCGEHS